MSVAAHLGIDLREYDARIRTFIPAYESMLETVARAVRTTVRRRHPVLLDLGIGTGALSAACLEAVPGARVIGIDEDGAMLAAAGERLGRRLAPAVHGSFERVPLPACDAVVASLALHHIPTPLRRVRLFRKVHAALRAGGALISFDCHPSSHARLAALERDDWLAHLQKAYSPSQARAFLRAWAKEDHYATLPDEIALLSRAGFTPDVSCRYGAFAVITAFR